MAFKMAGAPYPRKTLRERLTSAKEKVQGKVKQVVSDVAGIPGDIRESVETARANNPDVQAGKARRAARKAHRKAVDAWRAGGSKGPMPQKPK